MSDVLERMKRWDAIVGVDEAVARAVAEERAAVVAWLRGLRAIGHGRELLTALADDIERGEHRREEET